MVYFLRVLINVSFCSSRLNHHPHLPPVPVSTKELTKAAVAKSNFLPQQSLILYSCETLVPCMSVSFTHLVCVREAKVYSDSGMVYSVTSEKVSAVPRLGGGSGGSPWSLSMVWLILSMGIPVRWENRCEFKDRVCQFSWLTEGMWCLSKCRMWAQSQGCHTTNCPEEGRTRQWPWSFRRTLEWSHNLKNLHVAFTTVK